MRIRGRRRDGKRSIAVDAEYLNVGCGRRVADGWLNVDGSPSAWLAKHPRFRSLLVLCRVIPRRSEYLTWPSDILLHDVRKPLPFRSESFRGIYTSNMIHYLAPHELARMLQECHRVLRAGGVFRSRQLDLRKAAVGYLARTGDPYAAYDMAAVYELQREWQPRGAFVFQLGAELLSKLRVKCTYDVASLSCLLHEAGFTGIREVGYLDSRLTNIAELESETDFVTGFCLEAYKPGESGDAA